MAAFAEVAHSPSSIGTRLRRSVPDAADAVAPLDGAVSRSLAALIAGEIVPRLVLAHRPSQKPPGAQAGEPAPHVSVEAIAPLTLAADPRPLLAQVDRLLGAGMSVDTLMLDLLAPAARLLGRWWEEDRCDFVEVTMGLWRLQEVVRDVTGRVAPPTPRPGRRALFAAFPGDQHDFGATMVTETFRRHGWEAEMIVGAEMRALLAALACTEFDLVGLTVSCDCHSARLPSAILALRSVSRNPHLRVMIGGRVANEDPALAGRVGADGTASDASEALRIAEVLVETSSCCGACG